ncbi:MAG: DUF3500 domain-containing protein [Bacteroidetes bacterium]|nr:MAG: DUF3500 domain-containing protein [Bacteroidota bacterium]
MKSFLVLLLPVSLIAQTVKDDNTGSAKAIAFVKSLNEQQKAKAIFPFDDMNRYAWHYVPATMMARSGLAIKDIDSIQKMAFYELLKSFLSDEGYKRTQTIMSFEYLLKEMEPTNPHRIPENYFVSVYGHPGIDSVWAWKFTGHHLALNFTIVKNKPAFAPFFFGSNPAEVRQGPQKGLRILKDEEDLAFELVNSMNAEQKKTALFQLKAFADIVTTTAKEVSPLKPAGILTKDLNNDQKNLVNKIIVAYLSSMSPRLANARMAMVRTEDKNDIRFGWAGGLMKGEPHYYRIQGKTFLIEFDNTQNDANHIHMVWRDYDGDYGEDLLKEHYMNSNHHH